MSAPDGQQLRASSSSMPFSAYALAWWGKRRSAMLSWAVALMALASLVRMGYGAWRLLWQPTPMGATDLAQRWLEVRDMFAGQDVYLSNGNATYPPATMTMLWPVLGCPSFATAPRVGARRGGGHWRSLPWSLLRLWPRHPSRRLSSGWCFSVPSGHFGPLQSWRSIWD